MFMWHLCGLWGPYTQPAPFIGIAETQQGGPCAPASGRPSRADPWPRPLATADGTKPTYVCIYIYA